MSKTSQLCFSEGVSGDGYPNGQPWTSGPIVNNPSPAWRETITITSGATTTIAVPPTALWFRIVPPANSTMTKVFKTVSGDTGTRISPVSPWAMVFDATAVPASVYLTPTGTGGQTEQVDIAFG